MKFDTSIFLKIFDFESLTMGIVDRERIEESESWSKQEKICHPVV